MKIISNNKKAYYDYFIEEKIECGIVLKGTEIKSIRQGKCSIKESFIQIRNNECFILNMNISNYENGNIWNVDPVRERKLLLQKKEILKLKGQISEKGYTLVPLQVYIDDHSRAKVEIGLAKGKKKYDKRESIKNKDIERKIRKKLLS